MSQKAIKTIYWPDAELWAWLTAEAARRSELEHRRVSVSELVRAAVREVYAPLVAHEEDGET